MAMNHYVNGTQLAQIVYAEGNASVGFYGSNQTAEVTADATSINGSTSLDLAGTTITAHGLVYLGGRNISDGTSKNLSRLTRVGFPTLANNKSLNAFGSQGNNSSSGIDLYIDGSGNVRSTMFNDDGSRGLNAVDAGGGMSIDTWYDIGWTWNNSTRDLKIYLDAILLATHTSTRSFSTMWSGTSSPQLSLGYSGTATNTEIYVDEDVMWDEIVDFTSGGLNTNGASRTTYLTHTPTVVSSGGGTSKTVLGGQGFR